VALASTRICRLLLSDPSSLAKKKPPTDKPGPGVACFLTPRLEVHGPRQADPELSYFPSSLSATSSVIHVGFMTRLMAVFSIDVLTEPSFPFVLPVLVAGRSPVPRPALFWGLCVTLPFPFSFFSLPLFSSRFNRSKGEGPPFSSLSP